MNFPRRDFLKGSLAALGLSALGFARVFAAPDGFRPRGKPNLLLGVVSDTHLRTLKSRPAPRPWWSDTYLRRALEYFRSVNVDAVIHGGDMANYGEVEAMQMHADVWNEIFPRNRAPDGHVVEKLFVTGNHDAEGENANKRVRELYSDPAIRAKEVLSADMAGNWERIWGEPYEATWHKVVKGYHFFGAHWKADRMHMMELVKDAMSDESADAKGSVPPKPFFLLTHSRLLPPERNAIATYKDRALAFFGHNHESATNWNTIYYAPNTFPRIQIPPCISPDWDLKFRSEANVTRYPLAGKEKAGRCRQGFVVAVYDDMIVIRRHEFAEGGLLGPDWVMPLGEGRAPSRPHPFAKEELKKVIGEPQFREGAKLEVVKCCQRENVAKSNVANDQSACAEAAADKLEIGTGSGNNSTMATLNLSATPRLRVRIPLADGNPDSRVYAYEVVVIGDEGTQKLFKAVYATGCNMGIGHEPNGGVTTLEIAKEELPPGKTLTVAVRPLTSLGTSGRAIAKEVSV